MGLHGAAPHSLQSFVHRIAAEPAGVRKELLTALAGPWKLFHPRSRRVRRCQSGTAYAPQCMIATLCVVGAALYVCMGWKPLVDRL
jgi:hypothetical protein